MRFKGQNMFYFLMKPHTSSVVKIMMKKLAKIQWKLVIINVYGIQGKKNVKRTHSKRNVDNKHRPVHASLYRKHQSLLIFITLNVSLLTVTWKLLLL